ncbi:MAG TPA: YciI family protein [Streptosporangiaceae bacterium]|nr:YciI family protein [Streptosporangiaceae bacterium]
MSIDPGSIEFDTYELVLLRRTRQSQEFDEQTQERIFRAHAAYTIGLGAAGQVLAAGPVTESKPEDEPVTGFGIYQQGSHDAVRALVAKDPGVLQGQYTFEILTWRTRKGGIAFPRRDSVPPAETV